MSGKRIGLVFGTVVVLAVVGAQLWFVPASLGVTAQADGRLVHGHVTTDLPDGTRLYYEVSPALADVELADITWGDGTVVGGVMDFEADLRAKSWSTNEIDICVSFHMIDTEQPAHLVEMFGRNGERLSGAGVSRSDDGYNVMTTATTVALAPGP